MPQTTIIKNKIISSYVIKNLTEQTTDKIFGMTGFNYDIDIDYNEDGTETLYFDCEVDYLKFKMLLEEEIKNGIN